MSFIDIVAPIGFQCGFQSTLDFNKSKYCFKYEYDNNGKRCMIVGNDKNVFLDWFKHLPESQRKLYELIREDDIVAEYYDIDLSLDTQYTLEELDDMSNSIIRTLLDARNDVAQHILSNKDLIVLSAHTFDKLSLHIITTTTYFKNTRLHRLFALDVYKKLKEMTFFTIDISVYSKNRSFRMFMNHKHGKNNPLILFNPIIYNYASLEDTWVVLTHRDISQRVEIERYDDEELFMLEYHDEDEIMSDDLSHLLDNFIKQHPYLQAEKSAKKINRINRIDSTTRPCLTDPSDFHSTENMYWYIRDNGLYVGCFCKKGKHLHLGLRTGIVKFEYKPEQFDYATHCSDDFKEYSDFEKITTLYDKRRTGHGKTTCAMQYATGFTNVLLIHHRLSLDDDYIEKYPEFTSYQQGVNSAKQTVCFNSLNKIDVSKYELIIIDEIRSILKQTEMKDMIYSTHVLFNILENQSTPLIMLDANMTNDDIVFLSKFRKDANKIVIHDENTCNGKNVFIISSEMETLSKIDKCIRNREKVVIIYNRSIEKMNALLSPYIEEYRVLHINKLTRKGIDMNSNNWFDNFDIIAYSPTISEGVSIVDSRFKHIHAFGLFTSTSCPAESVSQMIARFRAIENFTIYIDTKRKKTIPMFHKKEDVLKYINSNIHRLNEISQSHYNVQRSGHKLAVIEDEFFELFCKNLLEQSLDYHNYKTTLVQKLINNGYEVFDDLRCDLSIEQVVDIKQTVDQLSKKERDRLNVCILNAPVLSVDEYNYIKDKGVTSEDDECKLFKYHIMHTINVSNNYLTKDIVGSFRNPSTRTIIRNIKQCFGFIRNDNGEIERISTRVLIKENAALLMDNFDRKLSFLDQKKCITNFSTSKLYWLNARIVELGFNYLLSPEGIPIDTFQSNMESIISHYKDPDNYTDYVNSELIFGKYFSKTKQTELTSKFITSKLTNLFSLTFGKDEHTKQVYQQINMPIRLYDREKRHPNILGDIVLSDSIVRDYNIMFMKGMLGNHCEICNTTMTRGNIGFKHLNSVIHKRNMNTTQNTILYIENLIEPVPA